MGSALRLQCRSKVQSSSAQTHLPTTALWQPRELAPLQPAALKPLKKVENLSGMDPGTVQDTGLKPLTPGTRVSCSLLSTLAVCSNSLGSCLSPCWKSNQHISIFRLLDASPSHGCSQLVLLLQRKADNIMNKAILRNAVLIEIFAAVVTIGLRQETFISEEIKLVSICRMGVRGVIGKREKKISQLQHHERGESFALLLAHLSRCMK